MYYLKEITEQYPDMKIVTFDTQFYSDGEYQSFRALPRCSSRISPW